MIMRTYKGFTYPQLGEILAYAVSVFGFLIPFNSSVSLDQFADRIEWYSCNERSLYIAQVIRGLSSRQPAI